MLFSAINSEERSDGLYPADNNSVPTHRKTSTLWLNQMVSYFEIKMSQMIKLFTSCLLLLSMSGAAFSQAPNYKVYALKFGLLKSSFCIHTCAFGKRSTPSIWSQCGCVTIISVISVGFKPSLRSTESGRI